MAYGCIDQDHPNPYYGRSLVTRVGKLELRIPQDRQGQFSTQIFERYHKHLKFTNMLERFNEEINRRIRVVRIFPNEASCLRLIRALAAGPMRTGWRPTAISIWSFSQNTRN